jgi:undecaprenyl-diphosphatase
MIAWIVRIDLAARSWIVLHRVAALDPLFVLFSEVGRSGMVWLVIASVLAIGKRISWRDVARLVLALAVALPLTDHVLKPTIHRSRPFVVSPSVMVIGSRPADASFPSGHATGAFVGAVVLSEAAPTLALVWWGLACCIAYSRVYLGVHYPLDVLAGASVGGGIAWLILTVTGSRPDTKPPAQA